MNPSDVLVWALLAAGSQASLRTLTRRRRWETENKRVQIVVDYDDVCAVSIRAGIGRGELLVELREHGATGVSLPELSLARLMRAGRLVSIVPQTPRRVPAPLGEWMYLSCAETGMAEYCVQELNVRLPQAQAAREPTDPRAFAYAGDLETVGEMGLGFESARADEIHTAGLSVVPRPISYAWADEPLIARTIAQAAKVGDGIVAFDGDLILGHEMHLAETVAALEKNALMYAYFAESRHQRGDWFIAKSRMPNVILAERMTPTQMIPEDFHSAAHRWAMLARERGIRLLYVNFFRIVHATTPLECLHYIEHIVEAVQHAGFEVETGIVQKPLLTVPQAETAQAGLVAAGTAALALTRVLGISEPYATGVTLAGATMPFVMGFLDKPRNELEQKYAPSYLPKLLALTTAIAAPIAATRLGAGGEWQGALGAGLIDASAATGLAALTTGTDYQMHVEEYRGYGLDVWLPLLTIALELQDARWRALGLGVGVMGWMLTRRRDVPGQFDRDHAATHTHHLSTAGRLIGDMQLRLGMRPARKWAWLAPVTVVLVNWFAARGERNRAVMASAASVMAREFMLVGFRKGERDIELTVSDTVSKYAVGAAVAVALFAMSRFGSRSDGS